MDDLDRLLEEELSNPEFRKEWEATQLDYDITELLIQARNSQHITQKELAIRAGVRQSNLSRIENGQCSPNLATLQKIAKGLGKKTAAAICVRNRGYCKKAPAARVLFS